MCWLALLLALSLATAAKEEVPPPDPAVLEAERQRLLEEMQQLARRQLWEGVEKKFQASLALGVPLSFDEYLTGALAARGLGDVQAAYDRLREAARIRPDKDVVDWLWNIDQQYGRVELLTVPPRSVDLSVEVMPFAPDQRAAVDFAVRKLKEEGSFRGLLPQGAYALQGQRFTVDPGLSIHLEVSPRKRSQVDKPPEATSPPPAP